MAFLCLAFLREATAPPVLTLQSIVVGLSALQPESRMKSRFVRLANCLTCSTFRANAESSPPSAGLITTTTRLLRLATRVTARSVRYGLTRSEEHTSELQSLRH